MDRQKSSASDLASKTHRTYMKIVSEASGGGTDEEDEKHEKDYKEVSSRDRNRQRKCVIEISSV